MLVAVTLVLALPTATARAEVTQLDSDAETEFVARANQERTERGVAPVTVAPDVVELARRHARRMADRGEIHHNPTLTAEAGVDWEELGENVGRGGGAPAVHAAFMASSTHAGVILRPTYTEVGVGVLRQGDTIWVVEVFRRRTAPSEPAAAAPPPGEEAPTSAPDAPVAHAPTDAVVAGSATAAPPPAQPEPGPTVPSDEADAPLPRPPQLVALGGLDRPSEPVDLAGATSIGHDDALPAPPGAALLAAALLPLLVGAQGAVVRRLGLA